MMLVAKPALEDLADLSPIYRSPAMPSIHCCARWVKALHRGSGIRGWHDGITVGQCRWEQVPDLAGIVAVQTGELDERCPVVPVDQPERRPPGDALRGQHVKRQPCDDQRRRGYFAASMSGPIVHTLSCPVCSSSREAFRRWAVPCCRAARVQPERQVPGHGRNLRRDRETVRRGDSLSDQGVHGRPGMDHLYRVQPRQRQLRSRKRQSRYQASGLRIPRLEHIYRATASRFKVHKNWISGIAFTKDGTRVVTSDHDQRALVWMITNGNVVNEITDIPNGVNCLAVTSGGTLFALAEGTEVSVRDLATGTRRLSSVGMPIPIVGLAFTRHGTKIAAASTDGNVAIWSFSG